jgi:SAM-dependent methyltransferase
MAPALRPVAEEVVRRASLRTGESVLDIGTGTGPAAGLATGDGRRVVGLDAAAGMLEIARREVSGVEFVEADFTELPMADGSFDVAIAAHALLFADDRVATLREWLRVVAPGGRISLSVPGPGDVVPATVLHHVYDRYGITWGDDYPTIAELAGWAAQAGWSDVETAADPTIGIPLADDELYRAWLSVGARGRATGDWTAQRRDEFARDLMAATPRSSDGGYWLPFGALYLIARKPR